MRHARGPTERELVTGLVRRVRAARGRTWRQTDLARALGVSQSYVARLEAGARTSPSLRLVRNLVNDGTPEQVAMTITGPKTRSVFDRYHIVARADLRAAAARIAARSGANRQGDRQAGAVPDEMSIHK
ncbi:MAG: helix-turn-helix transcriptional regulator [Candidatus Rokubacteria bacterium]|nr:helix-turn-helix transcriptional regulator [Candidatus Rokubacteria bacterium]